MTPTGGADSVDAVVVGAGHNGLVAANVLADAGWQVLVLEAQDWPGGAVRDAEVTAPGFRSDLFSAFYPLGVASPVLQALQLQRHGLRWRHSPAVLGHAVTPDKAAVLYRDVERTADSVAAFAPDDAAAWRRVYARWQRDGDAVLRALFRPFPPLGSAARLAASMRLPGLLRFTRFALQSVHRFVEEEFAGDGARMLFTGNALHTDLHPEGAGSAVYGWLLTMLGQQFGYPVPEGGSGRIIDALVARLAAGGGVVRCGEPVETVLVDGGTAVGVRTAGGSTVRARRAVLADVDALALYQRLLAGHALPARLADDLRRFQRDAPTLKVDWALRAPVPWSAPALSEAGTVHVGGRMDALLDHAADVCADRFPRRPFLLFGQMTTADPSRSPAGTESAWGYTHVPRGGLDDAAALDAHVSRMEERVEEFAPGFRDLVAGRHVQRPRDLQGKNANLVEGAVGGGTSSLHQQLVFRPVPGTGRPETVVDRLYLASSSAHPGGGVHGGPGSNAARAALLREGRAGRLASAAWRALLRASYADSSG